MGEKTEREVAIVVLDKAKEMLKSFLEKSEKKDVLEPETKVDPVESVHDLCHKKMDEEAKKAEKMKKCGKLSTFLAKKEAKRAAKAPKVE